MAKNTSIVLGKEQELKIENLRAAIGKGEESGLATAFDMDEFIAAKRRKKV